MSPIEPEHTNQESHAVGVRRKREAVLWGLAGVCLAGALVFYIYEAYRLSRFFGGFNGMEVARPADYPGIRSFLLICILGGTIVFGCVLQAFRVHRNTRHEEKR